MMGATSTQSKYDIRFLIEDLEILDFDISAAEKAAEIYRELKTQNQLIEFRDIFIAAICIVSNLSIVTLNKKHFSRISELNIV